MALMGRFPISTIHVGIFIVLILLRIFETIFQKPFQENYHIAVFGYFSGQFYLFHTLNFFWMKITLFLLKSLGTKKIRYKNPTEVVFQGIRVNCDILGHCRKGFRTPGQGLVASAYYLMTMYHIWHRFAYIILKL